MIKVFLISSDGRVILKESGNYFLVSPPYVTYKVIKYTDYLNLAYLTTDSGRVFPEHVAPSFSDWSTALSEIPNVVKEHSS